VINVSNSASNGNPGFLSEEPVRPAQPPRPTRPRAPARDATEHASPVRYGRIPAIGWVVLSWLAAIPRRLGAAIPHRLGARLFAMNDTEAYWRSWQITKTQGGLGRSYRDPRFGTLAEYPRCHRAGAI
jgi:hypothetical protein